VRGSPSSVRNRIKKSLEALEKAGWPHWKFSIGGSPSQVRWKYCDPFGHRWLLVHSGEIRRETEFHHARKQHQQNGRSHYQTKSACRELDHMKIDCRRTSSGRLRSFNGARSRFQRAGMQAKKETGTKGWVLGTDLAFLAIPTRSLIVASAPRLSRFRIDAVLGRVRWVVSINGTSVPRCRSSARASRSNTLEALAVCRTCVACSCRR